MWTSSLPIHLLVSFTRSVSSCSQQYAFMSFEDIETAYTFVYLTGLSTIWYNEALEKALELEMKARDWESRSVDELMEKFAFSSELQAGLRRESLEYRALLAQPDLRARLMHTYPAARAARDRIRDAGEAE